ncbi:hypothetical protein [Mycobacteroides abscessus]|uniref:hypothetical protein n=1 Tax=Mycobacteroides abscessus TaxID=36809 RepID=UPI002107245C|nr:hypothetical protein [Mycobacteroides abscessus]
MRDPYDPWADERAQATPEPVPIQDLDAIRNCDLCDTQGIRDQLPCRHIDHAQAARRGLATIRAQMGWNTTAGATTPETS